MKFSKYSCNDVGLSFRWWYISGARALLQQYAHFHTRYNLSAWRFDIFFSSCFLARYDYFFLRARSWFRLKRALAIVVRPHYLRGAAAYAIDATDWLRCAIYFRAYHARWHGMPAHARAYAPLPRSGAPAGDDIRHGAAMLRAATIPW